MVGVKAGGRTGLTAVTAAALFALSIVLAPLFALLPPVATSFVLVLVGAFLFEGLSRLPFHSAPHRISCFVTVALVPFSSVAVAIGQRPAAAHRQRSEHPPSAPHARALCARARCAVTGLLSFAVLALASGDRRLLRLWPMACCDSGDRPQEEEQEEQRSEGSLHDCDAELSAAPPSEAAGHYIAIPSARDRERPLVL